MILELQKKIWKNGFELTEKSLETLYNDKSFLRISSMGLNMNLWIQKSLGKTSNWLFKGLNVPTDDNMKGLLSEIHQLENQVDLQDDRIQELEKELRLLMDSLPKKKAATKTASNKRKVKKAVESTYSH